MSFLSKRKKDQTPKLNKKELNSDNNPLREYIQSEKAKKLVESTKSKGLSMAKKMGKKDGQKNIPALDIQNNSNSEKEITSFVQSKIDALGELKQVFLKDINSLKAKNQTYKEKNIDVDKEINQNQLTFEEEIEGIRSNSSKKIEQQTHFLNEKLKSAKKDLQIQKDKVRAIEAKGKFSNFVPNSNRQVWLMVSVIVALFEIVLSFQAFYIFKHNILISIGGAILYGLVIWILAHGAGNNFCNYRYSNNKTDLRRAFGIVTGGLIISFVLFICRFFYFGGFLMALAITILSFLAYCGAVYAEFMARIPSKYKEYLKAKEELSQKEQIVESLEKDFTQVETIITNEIREKERDKKEFEDSLKQQLQKYRLTLEETYQRVAESLPYLKKVESQLVAIHQMSIHEYRNRNEHHRTDDQTPAYWQSDISIPILKTNFQNVEIPIINPDGAGGFNVVGIESNDDDDPDSTDQGILVDTDPTTPPVISSNEKATLAYPLFNMLLLFLSISFLSSCTEGKSDNVSPPVLIVDIIDYTKDFDQDTLFDKSRSTRLVNSLSNPNTELTYLTTTLGNTSINPIEKEILPAKSLLENPLNREEQEKDFASKIDSVMEIQFRKRIKEDSQKSLIYEGFCGLMNETLKQKQWENHKITIVLNSDGIQNSSLFSFYGIDQDSFNPDTKKIDEIRTMLEKGQCTIPDLSGIDVNFEYQTNTENEVFVSKVRLFWKGLLESKGATVSFKSKI